MTLNKITDTGTQICENLCDLYIESFPEVERRDKKQIENLINSNKEMSFNAIMEDDEVDGLLVYWDFENFVYLEHFAIFPRLRNKGIGKKMLELLKNSTKKIIVLEVEPADDGMAGRRVSFYERCGFHVVDKDYEQPPYRPNGRTIPLWIMSNQDLDDATRNEIINTIKDKVYYNNY